MSVAISTEGQTMAASALMHWLRDKFELSRGDAGGNMRPMEGMRGLAVFFVFLVHYATLSNPWVARDSVLTTIAEAMHTIGITGVDLFFVLSGSLIYGSLMSRPQTFGKFMARRIERIYPAFLAVLALYLVLSWLFPAESKIPPGLSAATTYIVQNVLLLPGILPIQAIVTQAWSLSYEMLYYLAIPLLIEALDLRQRSAVQRMALFGGLAAGLALYSALFMGPVRLMMFVAGIFVFECLRHTGLRSPGSFAGGAAFLAGLGIMLLPIPGSIAYTLKISGLLTCFFVFCFTCFREPAGMLARLFCWTPLRWLGNISYSYYLMHGLALKAGFLLFGKFVAPGAYGPALVISLLPVMFVLTVIPSIALFLVVERPYSLRPKRRTNCKEHGPASAQP